jgi:hypothetical protein
MSFGSSATRGSSSKSIFHLFGSLQKTLSDYLTARHLPTPDDFGAVGDGVTDDTVAIGLWLDYLIANNVGGYLPDRVYLCDYISKAVNAGMTIFGAGTIKATGSNRLNMIRFTEARGLVDVSGITIDGDDIVARPLEIQNTGSTSITQGSVRIDSRVTIKNAKNNAPDTYTATGCYILGGFDHVIFEGSIDGVDSTSTTGASCAGLAVSWSAVASDDWVKKTVLSSTAIIKNVKNSNTVTADCDGVQCFAPASEFASFTVAAGATFEECKGRAIKSQVVGNSILGPVINRSVYDGLSEINLQYAGGIVSGAQVKHDGVRADSVISVTQRPSPDNTQCTISGNELTVLGVPASNTGAMIATDVTSAAVVCQGVTIRDNKVKGEVDAMVSCRVANVVNVNRIVIDGNWAESIGVAFLITSLYGSARAQLTVIFTNNGCESQCAGGSIVNDLIVEYARSNHNISPLIVDPYTVTIAAGVIVPYGSTHRVDTESAAATDDLETITATNREHDEWLTLYANSDARTVVLKDGVGNINLNGGDFSLTHSADRIVLAFDGTNWNEIVRSDNET